MRRHWYIYLDAVIRGTMMGITVAALAAGFKLDSLLPALFLIPAFGIQLWLNRLIVIWDPI